MSLRNLSKKMNADTHPQRRVTDKIKRSILIVDDEESLQDVMRVVLSQEGFSVVSSLSVGQSYDILHTIVPSLIICDYWIGSQNGVRFIEWIREEQYLSDVPVLFVTGEAEISGKVEHITNCHTLAKPFTIEELLCKVTDLLK